MKQNILAIHAKTVDFKQSEKDGGDHIKGTSLAYLLTDIAPGKNEKGFAPAKAFLTDKAEKGIETIPGIYEAEFSVTMKEGKPSMKLEAVKFLTEVTLSV